ncbi:MAG TPA: thioredoxin family protein [Lacunisphaera sp.]|jgi:thiol:disulfide interchange protein DsbD|nr:thioredoxin family protein [Lacunisphaera sp.]
MNLPRFLAAALLLPVLGLSHGLFAAESNVGHKGAVSAQLVTDAKAIQAGKPFTVALRLEHEPHWHSYWLNAGTGYPTSLNWTLPPGFKAGNIQWPTPHVVIDTSGKITGNGYTGEAWLLVEVTPPATLAAGTPVTLKAAAEWLMCKDVCMPGDAKLALDLPVAAPGASPDETLDTRWARLMTNARQQLPVAATDWELSASRDDQRVTLRLAPKAGNCHRPTGLHFFSADGLTDYAKPQAVREENGAWILEAPLDPAADKTTQRLSGVLASDNGWHTATGYGGMAVDVPLSAEVGRGVPSAPSSGSSISSGSTSSASALPAPTSLLATLLLAFVGGLILNLMPCVFPVLGIKILGFVNQSGSDRGKIVRHGLVFSAGVLVSFWLLAGALLVLRAGGAQLGWGFQLQSPAFVFVMAAFLLVFALNMSGLFEVGLAATGVGGELQMKEGFAGSFFTGALATLVATPCSAPFLAPALGAALSLPAVESFLVFTVIALGLSLPYLLLSIFPSAVKLLPRPGAWMETFKQLMAFPLYATVGWLVWVLAGQTKDDDNALLVILFGFVLVAMAAWAYGRFGQAHGKPARQAAGRVAAAALLVAGLWVGWPKTATAAPAGSYQVTWEKWSPDAIKAAQAAGKYVYVDFTARWCATCQTNKATVFHDDAVLAELKKKEVVLLRGDWTNRDPAITAELARWNRSAVPFNLIYAPGKPDPVVLPELLTPDRVLAGFASAAGK